MSSDAGQLTVVGVGYRVAGQVTVEAEAQLRHADCVFYLLNERITAYWLEGLNSQCSSLADCYVHGSPSIEAAEAMADRILAALDEGRNVCAAFDGHPTTYVPPLVFALQKARQKGYPVTILPGVSAIDCLFADLGVDPALHGWQVFDATHFLLHQPRFDIGSTLVLLQIASIGVHLYEKENLRRQARLQVLVEVLSESYSADQEVVLYEASPYPVSPPRIERLPLQELAGADVRINSTLYVPPRPRDALDSQMIERLGLDESLSSA